MRRIAVIGGGLAGLVVAHRRGQAGDRVTLFEASERLGGQLHTERTAGYTIEHGAEGFVAGSEAVRTLAAELGIEGDLVGQLVTRSYAFDGQRLVELKPGEAGERLGFQVARRELGKGIGSFREGMGELSGALARAVEGTVEVRLGTGVSSLTASGTEWRVASATHPAFAADAVVLATNSAEASRLLAPEFGETARALANAQAVSSVTVSLAYARSDVDHPLDATGFVVAESAQDEGFRACTFVSSKLPARAPAGKTLLRVFFRPAESDVALPDDALVTRGERSLRRALPLHGGFERAWVSRWQNALPVFDDAHRARVIELEAAFAGRGLVLAGSAFHGSGIDAAVRSAEAAARAFS
jgi:protoporphyrinogen/coproporphyrinogen III oxidase